MSDAKAKDQGDQQQKIVETKPLQSPDAQEVRLSGHVEMNRVEQTRTNASDGSLRHYQPVNHAGRKLPADWQEQNRSIELQDGETVISRVNSLKEANLAGADRRNADGKPYKVYTAEASQAVEKSGEISKELTEGAYQSTIKLNVQITNVPEVSPGLNPQDGLKYVGAVMDSGVAAVRQVEHHMTEPGAINSDIEKTANHFKQSPFQFQKDVLGAFLGAVDKLDKPMAPDERAFAAGAVMPMFFFEGVGKPLDSAAVNQMKLDQMTAQQLKELGIERVEMNMPKVPEHLQGLEYQPASKELIQAVEAKGRTVTVAKPGTAMWESLETVKADAKVMYPKCKEIVVKQGGSKVSLLEEFLHGTQEKIGLLGNPEIPFQFTEIHVKDFMIRHGRLLGLSENDLILLRELKRLEIEKFNRQGFRWLGP